MAPHTFLLIGMKAVCVANSGEQAKLARANPLKTQSVLMSEWMSRNVQGQGHLIHQDRWEIEEAGG